MTPYDCDVEYALSAYADYEVVKEFVEYCDPFLCVMPIAAEESLLEAYAKHLPMCSIRFRSGYIAGQTLTILTIQGLCDSFCTMRCSFVVHEQELKTYSTPLKIRETSSLVYHTHLFTILFLTALL